MTLAECNQHAFVWEQTAKKLDDIVVRLGPGMHKEFLEMQRVFALTMAGSYRDACDKLVPKEAGAAEKPPGLGNVLS